MPPWENRTFQPETLQLSEPAYIPIDTKNFTQFQYVDQYFDEEFYELLVNKSNQTSIYLTGKSLNLTVREFKVWLGINFVMAALQYPQVRMYWQNKWKVKLISEAMSRDRFFTIRKSIKLVFDNDVTPEERAKDRLWKVRPIIDIFLKCCHKIPREQHISIDEMMIPFSGSCGFKQYIPSKPNPVGLKAFVLANPNGIVCDMIIYQGTSTFPDEYKTKFSGLTQCAIMSLTRTLVPGHVIYIDRFYTTLALADSLLDSGFRMTGTIDNQRIPKYVGLISDKIISQEERGSIDLKVRPDNKVAIMKWFDNKPVTVLTKNEGTDPTLEVRRWSKAEKKYVTVKQPKSINSYNQKMGGVDLADRMLSYCSSRARTKKWTLRLILHIFDMAVSNGWLQFRNDQKMAEIPLHKIIQLRSYKLEYGQYLIEQNSLEALFDDNDEEEVMNENEHEEHTPSRKKTPVVLPSKERRYQGAVHLPQITGGIQNRCRAEKCKKKTSVMCTKCEVYLCLTAQRNCFLQFHKA